MKAVVQRVSSASVRIDGEIVSSINKGLLVLLGISESDDNKTIEWFSNKLINLRVFPDQDDKMNKSVLDINGSLLIVPNFTIYGDVQKGFRPSFTRAGNPKLTQPIFDKMVKFLTDNTSLIVETGVFGAMMDIELVNDGPVTIIIKK